MPASAIEIKFSWEGFAKVNILDVLKKAGYSGTEAKRLFKDGAVKIMDTKVTEDGNHFIWYQRRVSLMEVVEHKDILIVGKYKSLILKAKPFTWYEHIYYHLRDIVDQIKDMKFRGYYVFGGKK